MKTLILLLAIFLTTSVSAATCISLGSGDWNNPATWSCGAVPSAGDNITIAVGHTVVISVNTDITGAPTTLTIDGVLLFDQAGSKLRLGCGSTVYVSPTGSIQDSGVGQPSHSIRICGVDVWTGPEGTVTGPLVYGVPLPIELVYFDAVPNKSQIDFTWQTATELNNDYFSIEGSVDGFSWNAIQRIDGAGTTSEVQNYASSFNNGATNFTFFRLKQTDFDGKMSYSDMVSVQLEVEEMKVYPNPSNGSVVKIVLPASGPSFIQIIGLNGQIVYANDSQFTRQLSLDNLSLEPGTYLVHVTQNNSLMTERLIVQ